MEVKFVIDSVLVPAIQAWARARMDPDPHGVGPYQDEYQTSSLYFDTAARDVFHRRGSYARAKYRVRCYNTADRVFLERKLRRPAVLIKRRTASRAGSLERLSSAAIDADWAGAWFHRRLIARRLRPFAQVSYRRMARVLSCEGELTRLTLDWHLCVTQVAEPRFVLDEGVEFLEDRAILELKYRHYMPSQFRQLVEQLGLAPENASKYRLSIAHLSGVTPVLAQGIPSHQDAPHV